MESVYVIGHRNPDMDSVCSAIAYADLKNKVDKTAHYVAARCGHLNVPTANFFENEGLDKPLYLRDALIHVDDVVRREYEKLQADDPVYDLVRLHNSRETRSSVYPLYDGEKFRSLISVDGISSWFLRENSGDSRPAYDFNTDNFPKVLRGEFIRRGDRLFRASLLVGAMEKAMLESRLRKLKQSGNGVVLIIGNRVEYIELAKKYSAEAIVVVGVKADRLKAMDWSGFSGSVFLSRQDTSETIRLLRLSVPLSSVIDGECPRVVASDSFDDVKKMLADSEFRGFPVFSPGGEFIGFVTRRNFLDKPRRKFILVDHNESGQSVPGIEEAEIVEVIDHHRIAMEKTRIPIYVCAEPVGSTCTVVYQLYRRWHVKIDRKDALLMLAGVMADTVGMKSPTTTDADRACVSFLAGLLGTSADDFAARLFQSNSQLKDLDPRSSIISDFKQYCEGGVTFGIGQCEVGRMKDIDASALDEWLKTLDDVRSGRSLEWAMLLVTDISVCDSLLLVTDYPANAGLPYDRVGNLVYSLPGVLSRKKQLLPEIIRAIGER